MPDTKTILEKVMENTNCKPNPKKKNHILVSDRDELK